MADPQFFVVLEFDRDEDVPDGQYVEFYTSADEAHSLRDAEALDGEFDRQFRVFELREVSRG